MSDVATAEPTDAQMTGSYLLSGVIYAALADPYVHSHAGHPERSVNKPAREYVLPQALFYDTIVRLYGTEAITMAVYLGQRIYNEIVSGDRDRYGQLLQAISNEASVLMVSLREQNQALSDAAEAVIGELQDDTTDGLGQLANTLLEELASVEISTSEKEEPLE